MSIDTAIILLAGGVGTRMGADEAKQFIRIAGKPILLHSYEALRRHMPEAPMVVTVPVEAVDRVRAMLPAGDACVQVVPGGSSRQMSTAAGLRALRAQMPKNVLIHDAARPFISGQIIHGVLQALDKDEAVDVAIPTADTIIVERDGYIQSIPKRTHLRRGQTPQAFRYATLLRCYEDVGEERLDQFTDDCGIYLESTPFGRVRVVDGHEENIKITHALDLVLADELFRTQTQRSQARGPGLDVRNKRVVVFGGTAGIGKAVAQILMDAGADVHVFSRRNHCDVRDVDSVRRALAQAAGASQVIDHVINTTGVLINEKVADKSDANITEEISVNLTAAIHIAKAAYPYLKASRGMYLTFSSSSYTRGRANSVVYSATKAAVVALTQGLAEEWAQDGIRVNCMVPPRTDTEMRRSNFEGESQESLSNPYDVALRATSVLAAQVSGQIIRA